MKKLLFSIAIVAITFSSCRKDDNDGVTVGSTVMTSANTVPSNPSTATGKLEYSYNHNTRIFSYKATYASLTDSATGILFAQALPGTLFPTFTTQQFFFNGATNLQRRTTSTYNGLMTVDGVVVKLEDLKAGKYSVVLRSKTYNTGSGELRGQIVLP
jgi:hypothetical protein